MSINAIDPNASLYAFKAAQPRSAATESSPQAGGDVVNLSAKGAPSKVAFDSEGDAQAYDSVLNAAHTNPGMLAETHSGLDPERVYRLLGLLE